MKITRRQLRRIIRENIHGSLSEAAMGQEISTLGKKIGKEVGGLTSDEEKILNFIDHAISAMQDPQAIDHEEEILSLMLGIVEGVRSASRGHSREMWADKWEEKIHKRGGASMKELVNTLGHMLRDGGDSRMGVVGPFDEDDVTELRKKFAAAGLYYEAKPPKEPEQKPTVEKRPGGWDLFKSSLDEFKEAMADWDELDMIRHHEALEDKLDSDVEMDESLVSLIDKKSEMLEDKLDSLQQRGGRPDAEEEEEEGDIV